MPDVSGMDDDALLRYSRHILLDEIGVEGQGTLADACVALVGIGGLGSPAATYLAAAGVGRLKVIDDDDVDLTNLQRQTVFRPEDVGRPKADVAKRNLGLLNPDTDVVPVVERLGPANAPRLLADADVVLDGSDNFEARHASNQACLGLGKPLVSGAVVRFEAQASVFDFRREDTPCYSCLFPPDGEHEDEPCSRMGVFAPLAGMVGALMAGEALKIIALGESPLCGRLLLIDSKDLRVRNVAVPKDPSCPACSRRDDP